MSDPNFVAPEDKSSIQTIDAGESPTAAGDDGGKEQITGTYLDEYIKKDKELSKNNATQNRNVLSQRESEAFSPADSPRNAGEEHDMKVKKEQEEAAAAVAGGAAPPAPKKAESDPKRELDASKPREIAMTYTSDEMRRGRQHFFDLPDPTFYLGAALLIGCVSLFTWMASFIMENGDIKSMYLWIITGSCTFLMLVIPFIYYCVTSKHYHWCGKLWDGLVGALPCVLATFGIVFVYAFGIETIVNTATEKTNKEKKSEFLIYGTIPVFLLVVLPAFLAMIKFQDKISVESRKKDPLAAENNYARQPITSSGCVYLAVMFRRVVVGWVCGVCLAAHIALPAYALSWLAYGLYDLQNEQGIWVIFVILIPPILLIVVLAFIPFTRPVPLALWSLVVQYFWYPLMSWDPRDGGLWYRYDNGLTYERLVDQYNYQVKNAEKAFMRRQDAEADAYYSKAHVTRVLLNEKGVQYGIVDYASGQIVPAENGEGRGVPIGYGNLNQTQGTNGEGEHAVVAVPALPAASPDNPSGKKAAGEGEYDHGYQ